MNTEQMALGGQWSVTIFMIVIASWILYKFVVPKNFKEWRNAGLIQAFIIALYAEMYGFPLTIYFLSAFLGVDIPLLHFKGHLWSSLFGLGETGAMLEMILGYTIIFSGIYLLGRGWYSIYQAQKKDALSVKGLYRYIRHPQYTGIFLALFGQLIHWPTIITFILFPVIVLAYFLLSRKEEKAMISKFGEEYRAYMQKVPMFFPKIEDWPLLFEGDQNRKGAPL